MAAVTSRGAHRRAAVLRWTVLVVLGAYFVLPLFAMLDFSTQGSDGRSLAAWREIASDDELLAALKASLELAGLTALLMLVLLVPTMVWVHLRVPRLRRVVEFLCLLPLIIPAIVLVVGISSLYSWVTYFFGDSPLTLTFIYVVLVLPFSYRAVESGLTGMDLRTLSEAARSLGASWRTVMLRVVLPNVRGAVLSAALLSVALVLGEYTIASLLNFTTLQVDIALLGKRDATLAVTVALAALLFAFALLLVLSLASGRRRAVAVEEPLAVPPSAPAQEAAA